MNRTQAIAYAENEIQYLKFKKQTGWANKDISQRMAFFSYFLEITQEKEMVNACLMPQIQARRHQG